MATSGSSSTSRRSVDSSAVGVGDGKFSSPVRYREGLLDYEPAVRCNCGQKSARWVSWSDANPGRRYFTCVKARVGGCNFWRWYDPEASDFVNQNLLDLRDCVRALRKENKELKASTSNEHAKEEACAELRRLLVAKSKECAELRRIMVQNETAIVHLSDRVKKVENNRMLIVSVFACTVFVVVGFMVW